VNGRLTQEEDAELRRLAALTAYGKLGEQAAQVYAELRQRDRRLEVREPVDVVIPHPRAESDEAGARHRPISVR
jgi:hypothetical protein